MRAEISRGAVCGEIDAIPAKAYAHRILILSALAEGDTVVKNIFGSEDILATAGCLTALGAKIDDRGREYIVSPIRKIPESAVLDCAESGSTARFMLPVCGALGANAKFLGRGKLPSRPMAELLEILKKSGVSHDGDGIPLTISGKMTGDNFRVDGSLSSQYVTGMLLALAAMGGKRTLEVVGKKVSGSYIEITREIMSRFGVEARETESGFLVSGELKSPGEITVEGDWSNAAFWLVGGALGNGVKIKGLKFPTKQGDSVVAEFLTRMGGRVEFSENSVTSFPAKLKGADFDCADCPDLVPIMTVAAACADGVSRFYNVNRLKIKECDRLAAVEEMLGKCGIFAHDESDVLTIKGGKPNYAKVRGFSDHRIIMSAAILGSECGIGIDKIDGVKKSYPDFFRDFVKLGGKCDLTV